MSALDLGKVVGSKIHSSTGLPASGLGLPEDWAIDTASGDVYEKTAAAVWTKRGNFKGPQGVQGAAGPAGAKGVDGQTPTLSIDAAGHLIATYG